MPNGSFEETIACPNNYDQLNKTKYWYKPTQGTSDYFNTCDVTNAAGVPLNAIGFQYARTGIAYAGFVCGFDSLTLFREYLQVKLNTKLSYGKTYEVSFYVSRANGTGYALANIGCYLSDNPIGCNCSTYLSYIPQITSKENVFLIDTLNWEEIKGNYIANGNEEYLTIGYFKKNNDTLLVDATVNDITAYYYVDDVSITILNIGNEIPNVFTPNGDGINDVWQINLNTYTNIYFTVYNRWGLKVFESRNHFSWDGRTTSGEPCNAGTYYYLVQTETETYKGFLELIR